MADLTNITSANASLVLAFCCPHLLSAQGFPRCVAPAACPYDDSAVCRRPP